MTPAAPQALAAGSVSPTVGLSTSPELAIPRVFRAPKIEDFLTGARREAEAEITDFRQYQPGDGSAPTQQTSAYLSYDEHNLYITFVCKDQRDKVRARMSKREDIQDDDGVTVYLDSFHDRKHAYSFTVNPLGIQADALKTDGTSSLDYSFDTLWQSAGRLTPDGYIVWMAIPFKSLRFSSDADQTWGIALSRSILRDGEVDIWPRITQKKASFLDQLAELRGLNSISPSHNVQVIPYVTGAAARISNYDTTGYQSQHDVRGGMDGKMVFRNALTLDWTINPDFSQVESDDPQVTINQRYRVYFPEKRPFFIEDAGYFSTPINLFFTRNIVDPEFGTRLTGRVGKWSIGALAIDDRAPGEALSPGDPLFHDHAVIGATRVQRDFGDQSFFGVMFTDRTFGSSSNHAASFDTRIKLSARWFLTGQVVESFDRKPQTRGTPVHSDGTGYATSLTYSDRHLSYAAGYQDLNPDFRSPLGFIRRTDIREASNYLGYFWRPEGKPVLDYGFAGTVTADWNHRNQLQDLNSDLQFQIDLKGNTGFTMTRYDAYEAYLGQGFRYGTWGTTFYANWLKWLYVYGSYARGSGVNYYPAAELDPFLGTSRSASFGLKLRPKPRVRIEEAYYFSGLGTQQGFASSLNRPNVFDDHLSRTTINYQFTRALSLRGILDYYALLSNPSLFGQRPTKQLSGDVLLTYLLNPGTALYLGYNGSYENLALDPNQPPYLARFGPPTYLTGRQFFVKLTYRLRL